MSLQTGKSPGPDGWPAEVFKQCADQLCVPLSVLFVKSLVGGILPEDWKIGYITPRVHNIIVEESVLLWNSLYKRILQSISAFHRLLP